MADSTLVTLALNDWIIPSRCGIRATMVDSSEISLTSSIWKKASIPASLSMASASRVIPAAGMELEGRLCQPFFGY